MGCPEARLRSLRRPADSVVNVTQIATVDRRAVGERIRAPDWLVAQIGAGLARALALTRSWQA